MIDIFEKSECSGCSACLSICPQKCIHMEEDNEGFLYPVIDKEKCINCNMCDRVCPVKTKKYEDLNEFPKAYLCYEKNLDSRIASAAGGAFFGIAKTFIEKKNGVVVGAAYDDEFMVHHIIVKDIENLKLLQKSKYVQSDMDNIFKEIKEYLEKNIPVLFSGTPCQVAGLKRYIPEKLQLVLYCIDLSCHGVPSPKVYREYIKYQNSKHGGIKKVIMREKKVKKTMYRMGYGIEFKDGYKYFAPHGVDPMARLFFAHVCLRPICYECPFKTIGRLSDLTLGDCWYSEIFIENFQDKYGITALLQHSDKGNELLNLAKNLESKEVNSEKIIKINGGMIFKSATKSKKREDFFETLNSKKNISFKKLANKYAPAHKDSVKYKFITFLKENELIPRKLTQKKRNKEICKRLSVEISKTKYI